MKSNSMNWIAKNILPGFTMAAVVLGLFLLWLYSQPEPEQCLTDTECGCTLDCLETIHISPELDWLLEE